MITTRLPERMAGKISYIPYSACWVWVGRRDKLGYGRYGNDDKLAHRIVYQRLVGPIHPKLEIDHLCRNTWCVNPDHLDLVTHRVNLHRGNMTIWIQRRAVTHCPYGHEYTQKNTIINKRGSRACRICAYARSEAWRQVHGRRKP